MSTARKPRTAAKLGQLKIGRPAPGATQPADQKKSGDLTSVLARLRDQPAGADDGAVITALRPAAASPAPSAVPAEEARAAPPPEQPPAPPAVAEAPEPAPAIAEAPVAPAPVTEPLPAPEIAAEVEAEAAPAEIAVAEVPAEPPAAEIPVAEIAAPEIAVPEIAAAPAVQELPALEPVSEAPAPMPVETAPVEAPVVESVATEIEPEPAVVTTSEPPPVETPVAETPVAAESPVAEMPAATVELAPVEPAAALAVEPPPAAEPIAPELAAPEPPASEAPLPEPEAAAPAEPALAEPVPAEPPPAEAGPAEAAPAARAPLDDPFDMPAADAAVAPSEPPSDVAEPIFYPGFDSDNLVYPPQLPEGAPPPAASPIVAKARNNGEAAPAVVAEAGADRRATVQPDIYAYWLALKNGRRFPAAADLDQGRISNVWPNSLLLACDSSPRPKGADIRFMNAVKLGRPRRADDPLHEVNFTSMVTEWILTNGRNAVREASPLEGIDVFPARSGLVSYRVVVLPLSEDGDRIDHILCHVSLKS